MTAAQIEEARKRGMRGVYAKADTFASWQYGTFPYLPFPYQWHARYQALEKYGIDGTMESWSYGFKPNCVAEMRAWYSWSDAPPLDELCSTSIARREFGAGHRRPGAHRLEALQRGHPAGARYRPQHGHQQRRSHARCFLRSRSPAP